MHRQRREYKLMRIKYNKISSRNFEDKYYLKYSLSTIISDNSFKLFNIKSLEDLYQQYFNEESFEITNIENLFNKYILNTVGFSVAEVNFYHDLKKLKRKYYLHILLKEIYEKGNFFKKHTIIEIMQNQRFIDMFNSTEFILETKNIMEFRDIQWEKIDERLEMISKKIKGKIYLDKNEKNIIEISVLLKRIYMFFLDQENIIKEFNSEFHNITTIIKDKDFRRIVGYTNIRNNAKKLITNKGEIEWNKLNTIIHDFIENKIRLNDAKMNLNKYNILEYFNSIQDQYKRYLKEKNVNNFKPQEVILCDTKCVNICKVKFEKTKEYLECSKETCNCSEYEILNIIFANNDQKEKNNHLGLFSYVCIVMSLIIIMFISYNHYKKSSIFFQQENTEVTYELLTENENEIKI